MRALVLSGGGMFGAYQAGAWSALAPAFRPDVVIGSSIGALHAWLIAGERPAAEIVDRWLDGDGVPPIRWRWPRSPLDGAIDPSGFERLVREIHASATPRIPVAVTATELPRARRRLFRDGEITWKHLAASCALFGLLPQYRIGGRRYSDGGLTGALPLWAAAALGATEVVAIHLLPRLPWPLRWALAPLRRGNSAGAAAVRLIAPAAPLGGLRDACVWSRANARRWVEQGRRDAERCLARFSPDRRDVAPSGLFEPAPEH
jgi:predicted acylesterase/phospholipase RssA